MSRASRLLVAAIGAVLGCGIAGDSDFQVNSRIGASATLCATSGPDSVRYVITAQGFSKASDDSVARSISATLGESEVVVDHNGAASTFFAVELRGRRVGRLEVDQDGRSLLVVLDSLGSTSDGVGVGGSIACIKRLWGDVRGEADESGVLVWRDDDSPFSYRLDRGLVSSNEQASFAKRLSEEARVVAVLVALDSIPSEVRLRLSKP